MVIDLKKYRIVDLSEELVPGTLNTNGEYVHGSEVRRLEIREFLTAVGAFSTHHLDYLVRRLQVLATVYYPPTLTTDNPLRHNYPPTSIEVEHIFQSSLKQRFYTS